MMVLLVAWRAAEELRKDAVAHPIQIIARVGLGQQIRDENIVRQPAHHVLVSKTTERGYLLHKNIDGDLEKSVEIRVLDCLQRVERV